MNQINIQKIAEEIYKEFKPISVFLYGSRARTDSKSNSDFEVGVVIEKQGDVTRTELNEFVANKNILVYPFVGSELENYSLNTPFQKEIYMYELIKAGKTLAGDKFIENLTPLKITTISLIETLGFELGQALAAVFASRQNDDVNSLMEFVKSCLFGTRVLEIFVLKKFAFTFDEIYELSKEIDLEEYREVVDHAFEVRKNKSSPKEEFLYKNIGYLNKFIKDRIVEDFKEKGNREFI